MFKSFNLWPQINSSNKITDTSDVLMDYIYVTYISEYIQVVSKFCIL